MNTPIADFVKNYEKQNMTRLHMPGHKGKNFIGCEAMDITEICGADSLYEANGIIAESEANATKLFGSGMTLFSTEGSSQCIRAMLYLAMANHKGKEKPVVVATRNAHKAFLYAVAVLDLEVRWIWPEETNSLCSCPITGESVEKVLVNLKEPPIAVYVTSPDYLGGQLDIKEIAKVCHQYGTILVVDNAHGAYLRFLEPSSHPLDLGADMCCDSAHKTLPVLTGGAYLHLGKSISEKFAKQAKQAMALFGSTSPSYLILLSLDLCNLYLAEKYCEQLKRTINRINKLKMELKKNGWLIAETELLKLTVRMPSKRSGIDKAKELRNYDIECEYADAEYVVCMFTPENIEQDYIRVVQAFGVNQEVYTGKETIEIPHCVQATSIREAMFAKQKTISVKEASGCVCGAPTVSCPPAIPIVVAGEVISEDAMRLFKYYGIESVDVVER